MQNKAQEEITQLHIVGCMTKKAEGVDLADLFDMKTQEPLLLVTIKTNSKRESLKNSIAIYPRF